MKRWTLQGAILFAVALTIWAEVWFVPGTVRAVADTFPQVQHLVTPAIVWGVLTATCAQAVLVMGFLLTLDTPDDRPRRISRRAEWGAMLAFLLAFLALVVAAFTALNVQGYATPGVILMLVAAGFGASIAIASLIVFLGVTATVRQSKEVRALT